MRLSLARWIFTIGTEILLLLLLLIGESYLNFALMGISAIWFLVWGWKTRSFTFVRNHKNWQSPLVIAWLLWVLLLLWLLISAYFSISLPLSLDSVANWLFAWFMFWQVFVFKHWYKPIQWLGMIVTAIIAMTILSFIFQSFPFAASLLPGMNLLYPTYGHNHLAAVLLLIFPFSWWFSLSQPKSSLSKWFAIFPLVLALGLLFSSGRVAVVVGLFQLVFAGVWWLKDSNQFFTQNIYRATFVLFIFVSIAFSVLSIIPLIRKDFDCPIQIQGIKVCKDITKELRHFYWSQAISIVKEYPFTGSGPGTFEIASKKYAQSPSIASKFAHNAWLQESADMGIIGGFLFTMLMSMLLLLSSRSLFSEKNKNSLQVALLIGIAGVYFNAFFDFDWDFIGTAVLTFLMIGIVINSQQSQDNNQFLPRNIINKVPFAHLLLIHLVVVVLLGLGSMYVITDTLITTGRIQKAWHFFPYFRWHFKIFETTDQLDSDAKRRLSTIYEHHPETYISLLQQQTTGEERQKIIDKLVSLDPWQSTGHDLINHHILKQDWVTAAEKIKKTKETWDTLESKSNATINYSQKLHLVNQSMDIAKAFYERSDGVRAAEMHLLASQINPWFLLGEKPLFAQVNSSPETIIAYMEKMSVLESAFFGHQIDEYTEAYLLALIEEVASRKPIAVSDHAKRIVALNEGIKWRLWDELGGLLIEQLEQLMNSGDIEAAQQLADSAFELRQQLISREQSLGWDSEVKLSSLLVALGNKQILSKPELMFSNYKQASILNKWVFVDERLWFEDSSRNVVVERTVQTDFLYNYVVNTINEPNENIGWKADKHQELMIELLSRLLAEQRYDELIQLIYKVDSWNRINPEKREVIISQLRQAINFLVANNNEESAAELRDFIPVIESGSN